MEIFFPYAMVLVVLNTINSDNRVLATTAIFLVAEACEIFQKKLACLLKSHVISLYIIFHYA